MEIIIWLIIFFAIIWLISSETPEEVLCLILKDAYINLNIPIKDNYLLTKNDYEKLYSYFQSKANTDKTIPIIIFSIWYRLDRGLFISNAIWFADDCCVWLAREWLGDFSAGVKRYKKRQEALKKIFKL